MSKIVSRVIAFLASPSPGVVGYTLYWAKSKNDDGSDRVLNNNAGSGPVDSHVDVGLPPTREVEGETLHVVALDSIPELQALPEGEYDFGVAPRDAIGNEPDIVEAEDVALDITPPEKVGKVVVLSAP